MVTKEWLSLSEVSKLIGIHPSTVRNWADQGRLPVHRTQGGHRRFRRNDVELWMQSQRTDGHSPEADLVVQSALGRTRMRISEGMLEKEDWYRKLDNTAREQYRRSGRQLLQGLTTYLVSEKPIADAEARATGYEYASIGRRCGLSTVQAVNAFLFFRNMLLESMLSVYEAAAINSPYAWSDMLRNISAFTDQVLLSLLETYDALDNPKR
jgi:excisionase family DNA binding protein